MERLPFDPGKARGAKQPTERDGTQRPLSVSQLSASIEGALSEGLPRRISVRGEISGLKDQTHWYFTLKDEHAVISCVMFASAARKQSLRPVNGDEVIVTGRVEYWAKGGRIQLYAERIESVGQGSLEKQYQQLVAELRSLGWFDLDRKRPLPSFPARIAVVTSATGAALQDVIDTARRRCPAVELCTVDVRVQGESAALQIAHALDWLSEHHESLGIDAVILTRGGGSLEDLWAFNERAVARAVHDCRVPIVAAIGHETDTTIAELIADERCATPTQAAMRLLPDAAALLEQTAQLGRRLDARIIRLLADERRHLHSLLRLPALRSPTSVLEPKRDQLARLSVRLSHTIEQRIARSARLLHQRSDRLETHRPSAQLSARRRRLDRQSFRLDASICTRLRTTEHLDRFDQIHNAAARQIERRADRLGALGRELEVVSPLRILARGYTVTSDEQGRILRSVSEAGTASALLTTFSDGSVRSMVAGTPQPTPAVPRPTTPQPISPRAASKAIPRRSRKRRADKDADQMGLFGGGS